jgi:hypothetical protein
VPPTPPTVVPLYQLNWIDTSATESGFALYQSEAGGPFLVLGAYGAEHYGEPAPAGGRAAQLPGDGLQLWWGELAVAERPGDALSHPSTAIRPSPKVRYPVSAEISSVSPGWPAGTPDLLT